MCVCACMCVCSRDLWFELGCVLGSWRRYLFSFFNTLLLTSFPNLNMMGKPAKTLWFLFICSTWPRPHYKFLIKATPQRKKHNFVYASIKSDLLAALSSANANVLIVFSKSSCHCVLIADISGTMAAFLWKSLARPHYQPDTHVLSKESHQMGPIQVGCVVSPRDFLF